jgi:hypothetical protein
MVSPTSNTLGQIADMAPASATTPAASTDTLDSFAQQLETALETYLGQSGGASQFDINIQPSQGQESGSGQYTVTITTPPVAASSTAAATPVLAASATPVAETTSASAPAATGTASPEGGGLSAVLQDFTNGWSMMTPQQVAFQLANASGTGGSGDPNGLVAGTSLTFGQLTQTQQLAYQYAQNNGTSGLSMQDFLTQNAGPQAAWNLSYNQIQLVPQVEGVVDSSPSQVPNQYGMAPSASGNADNLPNPAMIQYLPQSEQAAAEAAVAAEGPYGQNIAAAVSAYDAAFG